MNAPHASGPLVAASQDISRRSVVVGFGFAGIAAALAAAGWSVETLAQGVTPAASPQPADELNALEVIYNHPEDSAAFQDYLMNNHLPLALQVQGIVSVIVHANMVVPELVPGDIYQIGTVVFESQAVMEEALATELAAEVMADLGNFATGGFSVYLASVQIMSVEGSATPTA